MLFSPESKLVRHTRHPLEVERTPKGGASDDRTNTKGFWLGVARLFSVDRHGRLWHPLFELELFVEIPIRQDQARRSFMQGFEKSGHHVETVVKAIIALGRELNMRVTVAGVETDAQADFLCDAGADQVQGCYFGRPIPASEAAIKIANEARSGRQNRATRCAAGKSLRLGCSLSLGGWPRRIMLLRIHYLVE
jgi:hypothetical protein